MYFYKNIAFELCKPSHHYRFFYFFTIILDNFMFLSGKSFTANQKMTAIVLKQKP